MDRNYITDTIKCTGIPRNCWFVKIPVPRYCVVKRYAMAGKGIYVIPKRRTFSTKNMYKNCKLTIWYRHIRQTRNTGITTWWGTTKIITSWGTEITNPHLWPSGLNVLVGQESRVHLPTAEYADSDGGISAVVRRWAAPWCGTNRALSQVSTTHLALYQSHREPRVPRGCRELLMGHPHGVHL